MLSKATEEVPKNLQNSTEEMNLLRFLTENHSDISNYIDNLSPHYFYDFFNQLYYEALASIANQDVSFDKNTIMVEAKKIATDRHKICDSFFEAGFEMTMLEAFLKLNDNNVEFFDNSLKIVKSCYLARSQYLLLQSTLKELTNGHLHLKSSENIDKLITKLNDIKAQDLTDFSELSCSYVKDSYMTRLLELMEAGADSIGISTTYKDLDAITTGLKNTNLAIIGGRPGMGKTSLAINMAHNQAEMLQDNDSDGVILFISLEMLPYELFSKMISIQTSITYSKQITANINDEELEKVKRASERVGKLPLYIYKPPKSSIKDIANFMREAVKRMNVKACYIDHLGRVKSSLAPNVPQFERVGQVITDFKLLAQELNIPVVVLCQLNRDSVKSKNNSKPCLTDLRSSGDIEQEADLVLFVHREEYHHMQNKPKKDQEVAAWEIELRKVKGQAEIIVAKNRNGALDSCLLNFVDYATRFEERTETQYIDEHGSCITKINVEDMLFDG